MSADLSVVMPLHDAAPWVGQAIRSVLDRADGLLEVIVVDDGSTDEGPDVARRFGDPVRVISQPNAGPAAARNRALREARGAIVGFLDADDVWLAGTPDPRRAAIEAGAGLVCAKAQPVVGAPGDEPTPFRWAMGGMQLGAVWLRREVVERHGGMDETIVHGEDVDWLLRLQDAGVERVDLPDAVVGYRMREGSLTRDKEATHRGLTSAIAASLRRRGELGGAGA